MPISNFQKVDFPPHLKTAFDELRVSMPHTILDAVNTYEIDTTEFGTSTSGAGAVAFVSPLTAIRLSVGTANGDAAKLRTHTNFRYQAGKGQHIKMTGFCSDAGQANQVRRWGYYDDNDGLFFQLTNTTLALVRRTSTGVEAGETVNQSAWNYDKMDGTGPSGETLDISKGNIYEIMFQWLGAGDAFFFINGFLVHTMVNHGKYAAQYMRTAALPLTWEVINTGASAAASYTFECCSVSSQSGADDPYVPFSITNPATRSVNNAIEVPLLSIQLKSTYAGLGNRMNVIPKWMSVGALTNGPVQYRLLLNPVLTGANFTSVDAKSGVNADVTATSLTGGLPIATGLLVGATDSIIRDLKDFFSMGTRKLRLQAFTGTSDIVTVSAIALSGGASATVRASLTWGEIR